MNPGAITCQNVFGNYFSAISGNLNFYYLLWIFYLKLRLNSKFIGGAISRYIGRLRPALSSSFLLRVVCRLARMHNESVMNAWPELGAKTKPLEYAKTAMNPSPPPKKKENPTFCTSSGRSGGFQSFTQRSAHTHIYIYIYAAKLVTGPRFGIFKVNNWATSKLITGPRSFLNYKNRGFRWFFGISVISLCSLFVCSYLPIF